MPAESCGGVMTRQVWQVAEAHPPGCCQTTTVTPSLPSPPQGLGLQLRGLPPAGLQQSVLVSPCRAFIAACFPGMVLGFDGQSASQEAHALLTTMSPRA